MADELLCTVDDAADAWPKFSALSDTRQASLVSRASQAVLDYCRRGFIARGVTETVDGAGRSRVWLRRTPIITVATVTVNGDPLDNTAGDAWHFDPGTGELGRGTGYHDARFGRTFPPGRGNVVVEYWGGYEAVPDPVVEATVWVVQWMATKAKISGVYQSESLGDYAYTLAAVPILPSDIAGLLANYVGPEVFA